MEMKEFLEYGATGLVALMMLAVLVPVVRAFIAEMRASRVERREMRQEHKEFITNHAAHQTEALLEVKAGLESIASSLGRLPCLDAECPEPPEHKE